MRSVHRESSCSPPCGAGKRLSSVAKLATAPPSDARQRKAMGMSTHGHQQLSEHHAGHAGSHADAKVRYTMLAVLLVVSEPLTANALAPDHETWLFRSAIAARRNRQRVDEASSDHCGREVVPSYDLRGGPHNPVHAGHSSSVQVQPPRPHAGPRASRRVRRARVVPSA